MNYTIIWSNFSFRSGRSL